MSWNYRIVHYRADHGGGYGLHEVYYNDQGQPIAMGENPAGFVSYEEEGKAVVEQALMMARTDARKRPVLEEPEEWPGFRPIKPSVEEDAGVLS